MVILEKNKGKNKIVGNFGEDVASKYLQEKNYKILEKNFLCYYGEIDIIAFFQEEYIFCEVKTRKNIKCGTPAESINFFKKKHIWNSAKYYLYSNNILNSKIRFDVIEIYIDKKKMYLNHIKNIMW